MAIHANDLIKAVTIYFSDEKDGKTEIPLSPLDGRIPEPNLLREMRQTGKTAEQIRVEMGVGSVVDHVITFLEKKITGSGRERG